MDAQRLGAVLRAVRLRRRLRQSDLARLAGVSDSTVSRIERGHLGPVTIGTLGAVAAALEVNLDHRAWTRGGDLDRLVNSAHAALVDRIVARFVQLEWMCRPEASFNHWGERGFIDVLAWHPGRRALLVIEAKTAIVDVGELLGTLDRKRRIAGNVARELGWDPAGSASVALIVRATRTNRRRIAAHRATLRAAMPSDGRDLAAHLRRPSAPVAAIAMWPDSHPRTTRPGHRAPGLPRRRGSSAR